MTRVILVISGKGGVGKTTLVSNLATVLAEQGNDVIVVDANLTTPNLGLHLGMHLAPQTLHDVLKGKAKLKDSTYPHPLGFKVIPASMNVEDLEGVDAGRLPEVALNLSGKADYVIMDGAAGLGREAVSAIQAADELLIVTNPDLPSVADALKTVKLAESIRKKIIGVVVNKVRKKGYELTREEVQEMIGYPVLAEVPHDVNVLKSIAAKQPIVSFDASSPASNEFRKIASYVSGKPVYLRRSRNGFFEKLINWMTG